MYFVYVLYSVDHDKIYIGYTTDVEARFLSHNELATKGWTISYRPWRLIYTEEFKTKAEALSQIAQPRPCVQRILFHHQGAQWPEMPSVVALTGSFAQEAVVSVLLPTRRHLLPFQ